jgi:hypothetical protein
MTSPDEQPRAAPRERRVEKRILRPDLSTTASIWLTRNASVMNNQGPGQIAAFGRQTAFQQ